MKIKKLKIKEQKLDINLKFYFFLKNLIKVQLTEGQSQKFLEKYTLFNGEAFDTYKEKITDYIDKEIQSVDKKRVLYVIIESIENAIDLDLFIFSLRLLFIKKLLLEEAKMANAFGTETLKDIGPLSLKYDKLSVYRPYTTRVNGALLSLLFFSKIEKRKVNFITGEALEFMKKLSDFAIRLKREGIEPNQIFMLMFSESVNQSIVSDSGSDYEDRILSVLTMIGIPKNEIKKIHDENDLSTEFDFFFKLKGRAFGISAKRTLRERYKQFIKTTHKSDVDVMIEITLGVDLNEEKAKLIRGHGIYIFVADEIYASRDFYKKIDGIYSVKDLNVETLASLK